MFRPATNVFDDVVAKATDENLTSENWELIMNVCDKVAESAAGPKDAIAAVIKRLGHRNANVQLYTLELANALSQNCGLPLHRELASRSFTEALLRLAAERNTHQKVKTKILERMMDWAEMFGSNPELGIMEQAYMRLKTQNPHLQPPSQPPKTMITESDKRREEEELQMALELSIREKDKQKQPGHGKQAGTQSSGAQSSHSTRSDAQAVAPGTTAATVSRVRALYDFVPTEAGELAFRKGDVIAVLESVYKDWWKGSLRGQKGIFPLNYVEKLQDPTQDELEREAQMEAEVFSEIKNVEKLLALLSTSAERGKGDVRDNEEITTLYHSTLAIRPKLIELIGKYSQKKDDFTQLNEKFIKARRDYETLIEASMTQAARPSYGGRPYQQYGAAPPQQDPYNHQYPGQSNDQSQRYYGHNAPEQSYPPANGPQPFYFVPPNQGQGGQPIRTQHDNASVDDLYASPPRTNLNSTARPASIAFDPRQRVNAGQGHMGPQELASDSFDSPTDGRPSYGQQPPQGIVPNHQGAAPTQAPPQQSYDNAYAPSAPDVASSQRPTSPYPQQQPPPQQMYSHPSASQGRVPSDPYSQYPPQSLPTQQRLSQSGPAGGAPVTSASPVHTQHAPPPQQQQHQAYAPVSQNNAPYAPSNVGSAAPSAPPGSAPGYAPAMPQGQAPSLPVAAGYPGYQAYNPNQQRPRETEWSGAAAAP